VVLLGVVERDVGVVQQCVERFVGAVVHGDPGAGGGVHGDVAVVGVQRGWLGEVGQDLRDLLGGVAVCGGQQQEKLVAGEASGGAAVTVRGDGEAFADEAQQVVADVVAVGVVDLLEPVQVDQRDGGRLVQ